MIDRFLNDNVFVLCSLCTSCLPIPNRYTETKVVKDVRIGNYARRRVQGEQLLTEEWREE